MKNWQNGSRCLKPKKAKAIELARELSHRRRDAARELTRRVAEELAFLAMPDVCFQVEQVRCPLNENGCDRIQFLISTNPGEDPKPLVENCIRRGIIPHYAGA